MFSAACGFLLARIPVVSKQIKVEKLTELERPSDVTEAEDDWFETIDRFDEVFWRLPNTADDAPSLHPANALSQPARSDLGQKHHADDYQQDRGHPRGFQLLRGVLQIPAHPTATEKA